MDINGHAMGIDWLEVPTIYIHIKGLSFTASISGTIPWKYIKIRPDMVPDPEIPVDFRFYRKNIERLMDNFWVALKNCHFWWHRLFQVTFGNLESQDANLWQFWTEAELSSFFLGHPQDYQSSKKTLGEEWQCLWCWHSWLHQSQDKTISEMRQLVNYTDYAKNGDVNVGQLSGKTTFSYTGLGLLD